MNAFSSAYATSLERSWIVFHTTWARFLTGSRAVLELLNSLSIIFLAYL